MSVVMGLASLVLLVAMANVGTLLVARGVERRQEMALRAGLGATRRWLVRQLVTESVLLALAGGVGGGIVAVWAADLVVAYFATGVGLELLRPDYLVDWWVFGFIATTAMAAGVLTGLAPALRSTWVELARAVGSGGRHAGGSVAGRRLTNGLVVLQVAVSMLLLVCAGVFVQSGRTAGAIDFGFRTDDLLGCRSIPRPGVRPGAGPRALPGHPGRRRRPPRRRIGKLGAPGPAVAGPEPEQRVHPGRRRGAGARRRAGLPQLRRLGLLRHVDIPVLRGRGFREEEAAGDRRVALVSERAARQLWPGQDAIGRRIVHGFIGGAPFEVIGVVRDAHMSPMSLFDRPPFVLYPVRVPRPPRRGRATLHVHTKEPLSAALPAVAGTSRPWRSWTVAA